MSKKLASNTSVPDESSAESGIKSDAVTPVADITDATIVDEVTKKPHRRILHVAGVARLLAKGRTTQQIADTFGVSYHAVRAFIIRNSDRLSDLKDGDEILATKVQNQLLDILDSVKPNDLKKAGLLQKYTSLGIGIEKMRLLQNKSTQNIQTLSKHVIALDKEGKIPDDIT